MELGVWGIIKEAPSLLALIPLILFIVLSFIEKINQNITLLISIVIGCILTGNGIPQFGSAMSSALSSSVGVIGFIIALGTGVGAVMTKTGVSKTLCQWIIKGIKVNTQKKAIIAIEICCVLICGLLGTLAGGCAIVAPVLIPVVAAVGLTPNTVGAVFQSAGETGLIWGPFTGPTVTLLALTGLSYGSMMIWAGLPYGIIWLVVIFFVALYIQKKTEGKYSYELDESDVIDSCISPEEKRVTIAFLLTFLALVVYAIATKQGMSYVISVMLILTLVMGIFSKLNANETISYFVKGVESAAGMWLTFILLEMLMNVIDCGGGFTALGELFTKVMGAPTQTMTMIVGTLVGSFGINGGAVAQLKVTHEMFLPSIEQCNLPMEMWAIALICGSRVTSSIYPGANMIAPMGCARSTDMKAMLLGGWAVSMISILYIMIWSFAGPMIFG